MPWPRRYYTKLLFLLAGKKEKTKDKYKTVWEKEIPGKTLMVRRGKIYE